MRLTDRQKFALALRRLQRAFAVAIYPPFGWLEPGELDIEFQKGLEISAEITEMRVARAKENGIAIGRFAARCTHHDKNGESP
ncbi:hypothetical protein LCGC14_2395810 [marine sediment metagenome]|uniref:Uncharacterized protein n=1 Tax=marine sediment metagenome TaxID=412755 RepID=A0A0F9BWS8_9ZZZZ